MIPENAEDYKLFYVDPHSKRDCPKVYFTTGDIFKECGDDWNDAPWEHNAGSPYCNKSDAEYFVMRVEDGDYTNMKTPDELGSYPNSIYSVDSINKGLAPWITVSIWRPEERAYEEHAELFPVGLSLKDFIIRAKRCGLTMWFLTVPYFQPTKG